MDYAAALRAYDEAALEAEAAWDAWRRADRGFRRDAYAAYRAALDREDVAARTLAAVARSSARAELPIAGA